MNASRLLVIIKACNNIQIRFRRLNSQNTTDFIEIGINLRNIILKQVMPIAETTMISKRLLSCVEHRPFWFQWRSDELQVGRGVICGTDQLEKWNFIQTAVITSVEIGTKSDDITDWLVFNEGKEGVVNYCRQGRDGMKYVGHEILWRI